MPNLYFFMHGTHVHHLNYGIFLMSAVCGYSVFRRPTGRAAEITALLYGVAMGLTFDEFGMWLHLGRQLLAMRERGRGDCGVGAVRAVCLRAVAGEV